MATSTQPNTPGVAVQAAPTKGEPLFCRTCRSEGRFVLATRLLPSPTGGRWAKRTGYCDVHLPTTIESRRRLRWITDNTLVFPDLQPSSAPEAVSREEFDMVVEVVGEVGEKVAAQVDAIESLRDGVKALAERQANVAGALGDLRTAVQEVGARAAAPDRDIDPARIFLAGIDGLRERLAKGEIAAMTARNLQSDIAAQAKRIVEAERERDAAREQVAALELDAARFQVIENGDAIVFNHVRYVRVQPTAKVLVAPIAPGVPALVGDSNRTEIDRITNHAIGEVFTAAVQTLTGYLEAATLNRLRWPLHVSPKAERQYASLVAREKEAILKAVGMYVENAPNCPTVRWGNDPKLQSVRAGKRRIEILRNDDGYTIVGIFAYTDHR
jgi:hypothetical protein